MLHLSYIILKYPPKGVGVLPSHKEYYKHSGLYQAIKQKLIKTTDQYQPPQYKDYFNIVVEEPLADIPIYRPWLLARFTTLGGILQQKNVLSLTEITDTFPVVINCTGWESRRLSQDTSVIPSRGQVEITTQATPAIPCTLNIAPLGIYIAFRPGSNDCVIGASETPYDISTQPRQQDKDMLIKTAARVCPSIIHLPTRSQVGIRCSRNGDTRLDQETIINPETQQPVTIIHCYGHDGSGVSASWGSACTDFTALSQYSLISNTSTYGSKTLNIPKRNHF